MIVRDAAESAGTFVVFQGAARIASGPLAVAAEAAKAAMDRDPTATLLVFDAQTGRVVDLDLRGTAAEVRARYAEASARPAGRGRPRLGVVPREVTLLPRHWDWLARQPGGASVALRKLVEAASRREAQGEDARARNEGAYRFMAAMAGDLPGFEEASRALFAGDRAALRERIAPWPADIGDQVLRILGAEEA
jgi:hypothetical protein